jgi:hypothetical protein
MSWSFSPSHALLLVFPHLFGSQGGSGPFTAPYGGEWSLTELSGYVGAAALVLAAAGLGPPAAPDGSCPSPSWPSWPASSPSATRPGRSPRPRPPRPRPAALVGSGHRGRRPRRRRARRLRHRPAADRRTWRSTGGRRRRRRARLAVGSRGTGCTAGGRRRRRGWSWCSPAPPCSHRTAPQAPTDGGAIALPLGAVAAVVVATRMPRAALSSLLVVVVAADMVLSFGWWHRWREQSPTTAEVAAVLDPDVAPRWGQVPDTPGGVDRVAFAFREPLRALPDIPRATSARASAPSAATTRWRPAPTSTSRGSTTGARWIPARGSSRPAPTWPTCSGSRGWSATTWPGGRDRQPCPRRSSPGRRGPPADGRRSPPPRARCRSTPPPPPWSRGASRASPPTSRAGRSRRCGAVGPVLGGGGGRRRPAGGAGAQRRVGPGLVGHGRRPTGAGRAGRRRGAGRAGARGPLGRLAAPPPARLLAGATSSAAPWGPARPQPPGSNQSRSSWKGFDVSTADHSGYQYVRAATGQPGDDPGADGPPPPAPGRPRG